MLSKKRWRIILNSKKLLIIVWLFSFTLMLPIIIFSGVEKIPKFINSTEDRNFTDNNQRVTCTVTWPVNRFIQTDALYVIYGITFSFIVPVILIIFCYICVIKRLRKETQKLINQLRKKHSAYRKVTILVLSVISIYIICNTPYWIHQIVLLMYYTIFKSQSVTFYQISSRLSIIFQIALFFNSALNPYIYAFLSRSFRKSFKKVFTKFSCQKYLKRKTFNKLNH